MERKDAIRNAYRMTGSGNFYDGMITCSTLHRREAPAGNRFTLQTTNLLEVSELRHFHAV